jgi:hypothetical protein
MPGTPAELLHNWHDFYILIGTASATLVGLLFVAASIGASIFTEENKAPLGAFLTPTVTHFGGVLFTSLLVIVPTHSWPTLGISVGAIGIAGVVYCGRILTQIIIRYRSKVDLTDRLFYALFPVAGHILLAGSAVALFSRPSEAVNLLAASLLMLLFAGIRNAWDMMLWIMIKAPTASGPPPPSGS